MTMIKNALFCASLSVLVLISPQLSIAAQVGTPSKAATTKPAQSAVNWTTVYGTTPDGGYTIGNPKARLVLTEFGSYTCSHCQHFHLEDRPKLMAYVAKGQVRYEFRSYLRNSLDILVSMVTYCQTPQRFWGMTDLMYRRLPDWSKGFASITEDEQKKWQGKPMISILPQIAARGGLVEFLRQKGFPAATTNKCLSDSNTLTKLQASQKVAYEKYAIQGTPSFLLNGKLLEDANSWDMVEPHLKAGL